MSILIPVAFAQYPSDDPDYDNYEYGKYLDKLIEDFVNEDDLPDTIPPEIVPDCFDCPEWDRYQDFIKWWEEQRKKVPPTGGDPLVFSINGEPEINRVYLGETHPSRITQLDLFDNGEIVSLDRIIEKDTYLVGVDWNGNGILDSGREYLWHNSINVYDFFSIIDTKNNGFIDYADTVWPAILIKEGDNHYTPEELGILGFYYDNYNHTIHDMWGERQYADCMYEGHYYYHECVVASTSHFPIVAWNDNSVIFKGGNTVDSFGLVLGYVE
jgi:hypothetical protein